MAKTKIELGVNMTGQETVADAEKKVLSLKDELKVLKGLMRDGIFEGDEFQQVAARAGEVQHKISQVNKTVNNLAKDSAGLHAFVSITQGIAGGFAAVQGITSLVADGNEELQKTMVKLQATMTAVNGIQAIANTLQADGAVGVQLLTGAWGRLNNVMKASIIGAIVAAVALLVSYWDDIREAISGVSAETRKLEKATKADYEASVKKTNELGNQDNLLKQQGLSEKEILRLKIAQTSETIAKGEKELLIQKSVLKAQVESDKKNKEILVGIIKFVEAPITLLLGAIDGIGAAFGKAFGLNSAFQNTIANFFFNPDETKKKGDAEIDAIDKTLLELRDKRAGFQLDIKAIDKKSFEDIKAKNKKNNEDLKKYFDDQKAILDDANKIIAEQFLSDREKEYFELDAKYKTLLDKTEEGSKNEAAVREAWLVQRQAISDKYAEQDLKNDEEKKAKQKEAEDKLNAYILASHKATQEAKQTISNETFNILNSLSELALGQQYKQTALGKTLALAQIATDTALAISALVRNSEANPLNAATSGLAGVAQFISGLARITANIAKAKNILSSGGSAASSGGGSFGQSQSSQPPPIKGFVPTDSQGKPINDSRVYVVETDITKTVKRVARIQQNAELI